jgi:uncharacterized protein (TIRG00374 family)
LTIGRIARYLVSVALAALALYVVLGKRDELSGASSYLDDLHWQWLAIGAACEAVSIVAYAALQRRLLRAGGANLGMTSLTGITLAGNAIENSLPAGPIFSAVFAFRQFRHRGADDMLSGWTLVGAAALSQITLVTLAALGLSVAAGTGSALDLVEVILGMVVVVLMVLWAWRHRGQILIHLVRPLELVQRVFHRPAGDARTLVQRASARVAAITPSRADWTVSGSYAMANWLFDVGCLVFAFLAVGAAIPWRALLLAYAAGQLATNLPITPGGLGVVEGSLTIALVAYGGAQASTVAAVLLYRLMSFWALLPAGYISWGLVTWDLRRGAAQAEVATA